MSITTLNLVETLLLAICLVTTPALAADKPNVILIMADDLGYGELGCYGSQRFQTPHIDALAKSGLRMTDFHSNGAVCSPTRAALMTGRYQQRCGIDGVVTAKNHRDTGMGLEEETVAEMLKRAGYATAIFGKWHLGYDSRFNPTQQGFDEFQGFVSGNIDLFSHIDQEFWFDWWVEKQLRYVPGYAPHRITELGIDFIRRHKHQPFFLYLPHPAPHYPYQGPGDRANRTVRQGFRPDGLNDLEVVPALDRSMAAGTYKEMIEDLDAQVGRIVAELDRQQIRERSLVIFCSDNGGTGRQSLGSDNGPLRGKKGQIYEGGHRVAGIINWPGKIQPGTSDETVLSFDFMPTFADLAGIKPQAKLDGVSLTGLLFQRTSLAPRPLLWMTADKTAYRLGDWKLLIQGKRTELYNLREDLSESNDQSDRQPGRKQQMLADALRLRETIRGGRKMKSGQ